MKRLHAGWRLALASPLALLLAGFLSVPLSVYASTEIDVTSVTNRYFVDFDDYNTFVSNQVDYCDEVLATCSEVDGNLSSARGRASSALTYANNIEYRQQRILDDQDARSSWDQAYLSLGYARSSQTNLNACIDNIDASRASLNELSESTLAVKSALLSSVPTYQIVVETYAGGGGCSCPDYSTVLAQINARVLLIYSELNSHLGNLDDYLYVVGNILFELYSSADSECSGSSSAEYPGAAFGSSLGSTVSNILDYVRSLNIYAYHGGLTYDNYVTSGSPLMQELWNWILLPYAQLLLPNTDSHNTDNRMVNAIRDFYLEPTVWVTNSYTKPLWVNMMTNGIGGSAEHPILVELTSSGSNVSVDNPVWVQFTNSVHVDVGSLSSLTNLQFELNWTPLFDLTNSVWMVAVVNSNDIAGAILDEEQRRVDDALDDESEQPTQETTTMPTVSLSFLQSVRSSYRDILTAYKGMFNSIPSEPPQDIVLWQGGNYGDVEIRSIHWHPSDERTVLNHVRSLFSFGWYCLYVFVIFVTAAIDLCVCGVLVYMLYGLLLGDKEVAYNGMLWCFKCLASFFGYKPPSAK